MSQTPVLKTARIAGPVACGERSRHMSEPCPGLTRARAGTTWAGFRRRAAGEPIMWNRNESTVMPTRGASPIAIPAPSRSIM